MQRVSSVVLLLSGLVLLIMVSVYLVLMEFQKKAALSAVSPFGYIPADAGMVFRISKPFEFAATFDNNNPFPKEITNLIPLRRFRDLMIKSDTIFDFEENSRIIPENTSLIISWHNIDKPEENTWLFVIELPRRNKAEESALHIAEHFFPDSPVLKSDTANMTFYSISISEQYEELHFSTEKNFVVLSSDKNLIFKSLYSARNHSGLASSTASFSDLVTNTPEETDCIFIEPSLFCGFITDFFFWDHPLSFDCSFISGWMSLMVSQDKETPGFDGFLLRQMHTSGIFSTLNFQEPAETIIKEFVPVNSSLVYHHHLADIELFEQDFRFILQQNKKYSLFEFHKRRFSDVAGISTDSISGYWTGELAMVLPGEQQWENEYPVLLFGTKNFEELLQHPRLGIFFLSPSYDHETYHTPGRLIEISIPGFFQVFTHGLVKDDLKWAIYNNDYIIASSKKENLLKYFEILDDEKETINKPNEMFLQNAFNDKHNIMFYFSIPRLLETFEVMFTDRFLDLQELSKPSFPEFGQMIMQFSTGPGDRINSSVRLSFIDSMSVDSLSELRDDETTQKNKVMLNLQSRR